MVTNCLCCRWPEEQKTFAQQMIRLWETYQDRRLESFEVVFTHGQTPQVRRVHKEVTIQAKKSSTL